MTNTAYARDENEEIYVRNIDVLNPAPELLQVRMADAGQIFYARPNVVVRGVFSDLDSLSAFSQDFTSSYYLVYHRDRPNASAVFIELIQGNGPDIFEPKSYGSLPSHVQELVPQEFIKF